ncbi:MAG: NAD-dependent epimerase/dehydratase family protein [Campylobacterales bacterium]|nr:NAD-dependent epimerase/dehydratase family protein [Campylobacterales bacterium]
MNILIAGGSGFIGNKIIEHFKDYNFINISKTKKATNVSNNIIMDLSSEGSSLDLNFDKPIDMIINCIDTKEAKEKGIRNDIVETTRTLIQIAKKNRIEKLIHLSITNPEDIKDDYQKSKFLAEKAVENSNLKFMIFRLSLLFGEGSQLDRLVDRIKEKKRIVQIGDPRDKISPVHINDVIKNVKEAIKGDSTSWYETYTICGPEYMSFKEFLERRAEKELKIYNVPKLIEKMFVRSIADDKTKRIAVALESSYFHNNNFVNHPLVRPTTFY